MHANEQLTVRALRVRGVEVPLARPIETAAGVMQTTPLVLIDLLTDEGPTGRSYLRCYTPAALAPLVRLVDNLAPLLVGAPAEPAAAKARLARHFRLLGTQGLVGVAIAGIDMAVWDALAKARGQPLAAVLGGEPRPLPAYATLRAMAPAAAAAEAEEVVDAGFTALKVKLGGPGDLAADLATIDAIRRAVGDDVELMVDFNQSLSIDGALARVPALDERGLTWIEEPARADDFAGHARIAATARTPIQLGENWWGPEDAEKSIAAGASDHATLDVMKIGGVSGWLRAAALAEAAGLPASSHAFVEYSAQLLSVTATAHRLEYADHAGPLLVEPLRAVDGYALPPTGPGSGVEWDEQAIEGLQR
ncbi:MAG: mandelate racemase [Actinomycetota bacterium]|nr:mandelate racemase [Actinomycetota bacterium]